MRMETTSGNNHFTWFSLSSPFTFYSTYLYSATLYGVHNIYIIIVYVNRLQDQHRQTKPGTVQDAAVEWPCVPSPFFSSSFFSGLRVHNPKHPLDSYKSMNLFGKVPKYHAGYLDLHIRPFRHYCTRFKRISVSTVFNFKISSATCPVLVAGAYLWMRWSLITFSVDLGGLPDMTTVITPWKFHYGVV